MTEPTTYAFIDAANIIYRTESENAWKIDLKKLSQYLRERFHVGRLLYYAGVDQRDRIQLRLYEQMRSWGYELRLNPVKHFINHRGERYRKADVDARMAFEAMMHEKEFQRAVFLTGDGDFYWLLEYLLSRKEKVWLLSQPKKTAKELKKLFGEKFANLDNLRMHLEYKKETDSTNDSVSGLTEKF